jgi:hypothetical protein
MHLNAFVSSYPFLMFFNTCFRNAMEHSGGSDIYSMVEKIPNSLGNLSNKYKITWDLSTHLNFWSMKFSLASLNVLFKIIFWFKNIIVVVNSLSQFISLSISFMKINLCLILFVTVCNKCSISSQEARSSVSKCKWGF